MRHYQRRILYFCITLSFLSVSEVNSQELFPLNEPSTQIPKGVLGVKFINEYYKEFDKHRHLQGYRVMYGLFRNATIMTTATFSNHHSRNLPYDITSHSHNYNGTAPAYPYLFNGFNFYFKYRFFTRDGKNRHLRMALYSEYSTISTAHDEAEPRLMDDTGGFSSGLIITALKEKFAVSLTTGKILPTPFTDNVLGQKVTLDYGDAWQYNLSFGYLIYPKVYSTYEETNYSFYAEFIGKSYEAGNIYIDDVWAPSQSELFIKRNYVECHLGIQQVIKSNTRIDLSLGFDVLSNAVLFDHH